MTKRLPKDTKPGALLRKKLKIKRQHTIPEMIQSRADMEGKNHRDQQAKQARLAVPLGLQKKPRPPKKMTTEQFMEQGRKNSAAIRRAKL